MKRVSSLLLVLALFLTMAISFSACKKEKKNEDKAPEETGKLSGVNAEIGRAEFINGIGGTSETYRGAVSEQSYASAQEAAQNYVYQEVVGSQNATVESTTSKGTLSDAQISQLNLPAEVSQGLQSVEQIEVAYSIANTLEGEDGVQVLPVAAAGKSKVVVYVIKYEVDWKYYVPCPVNGETISKRYYDSVFDNEKYQNCTLTSTTKMFVDIDADMGGQKEQGTLELTVTQLIKHADNRVYFEQTITVGATGLYEGMESSLGYKPGTIRAYLEENENGTMKCYIENGSKWSEGSLYGIGFTSVKELTPFYGQYLDYSYFTKTDFGFALQDENAQQYIDTALAQLTAMLQSGDKWDYNMYSEYYVSQGVLSGMRTDMEVVVDMSQSGVDMSIYETVQQTITCTNYGTTVVEDVVK